MIGGESDRVWVIDTSSILEIRRQVPTVGRRRCLEGLRSRVLWRGRACVGGGGCCNGGCLVCCVGLGCCWRPFGEQVCYPSFGPRAAIVLQRNGATRVLLDRVYQTSDKGKSPRLNPLPPS